MEHACSNLAVTFGLVLALLSLAACTRSAPITPSPAAGTAINETRPISGKVLHSAGQTYQVVYSTIPDPIPLNEPFAIETTIVETAQPTRPPDDFDFAVDARMPHHRHGMTVQPKITKIRPGVFQITGMLFHMPGRWEIYFDITRAGRTERAQDVVFLD